MKKQLLISSAIAYDRWASGIPEVRYPVGSDAQTVAKAKNIARDVRVNERAYVTFEGQEEDGWSLNIRSGAGSIADPIPLLRHYDSQIMAAGLASFAEFPDEAG